MPWLLIQKEPQSQIHFTWSPETALTTRAERRVPCLHSSRDLTLCLKQHTHPETHVRTGEEA